MPFAILFQIIARAFIWIIFLSSEIFAPVFVKTFPNNHWYYFAAMMLSSVTFFVVSYLESNDLILDIRELCFYEIVIFGLGGVLFWSGIHPANFIVGLMNVSTFLKYGRLLWFSRTKNGEAFASWPTFGLVGWYTKRRRKSCQPSLVVAPSARQTVEFYSFVLLCFIVGFFLPYLHISLTAWQVGIMAFFAAAIVGKLTLVDLKRKHTAYINNIKAIAKAEATAEKQREIAAEKEHSNKVLQAKNIELEAAKAEALQAKLEAEHARDEAERAKAHEETISRALRTASHDLQQSIALIGFAGNEMVQATSIAERERALETFYDVNNKVSTAIEQIMYYAKLTTKQAQPKIQAIEICSTLHRLSTQWMAAGFEKGVDVILTYPRQEEIKRYVACDPMLLLHVLQNLLINAILHGGPTCDRIFLCARNRADHYLVQVRDCGKGIEECDGADEYANFAAFAKRVYERGTQRGDGHGLGVNIVKQMCEVAGIRIGLRSRVGGGTTFNLRIAKASVELIDETAAIVADNLQSREQAKVLRFSK